MSIKGRGPGRPRSGCGRPEQAQARIGEGLCDRVRLLALASDRSLIRQLARLLRVGLELPGVGHQPEPATVRVWVPLDLLARARRLAQEEGRTLTAELSRRLWAAIERAEGQGGAG